MHSVERRPLPSIPLRFRDRTLHGYVPASDGQTKALAAAHRLVAGEIRNLVLVGPPGVGKTHLAAGIANGIADRAWAEFEAQLDGASDRYPQIPQNPEWLNVADAIVQMRLEISGPLDDRGTTLDVSRAHAYGALYVLDDLGREKVSDWTGETIYALVNARYEAMLPTVVTSNLTAAELADSPYWPAISRLAEDGELVRVDGKDRRLIR